MGRKGLRAEPPWGGGTWRDGAPDGRQRRSHGVSSGAGGGSPGEEVIGAGSGYTRATPRRAVGKGDRCRGRAHARARRGGARSWVNGARGERDADGQDDEEACEVGAWRPERDRADEEEPGGDGGRSEAGRG